jgi:flagellar motility protein MotE (MotC chaperone)
VLTIQRGRLLAMAFGVLIFAKVGLSIPTFPEVFGDQGSLMAAEDETSQGEAPEKPVVIIDQETIKNTNSQTPEVLLLSIQNERKLIAQQKNQLAARMAEIALAEEKLAVEKRALNELKTMLEGILQKVEESQSADLDRLVDFYQNMKPKDAARIMDDLDIEVTILVMTTMKPRDAAPIMAKMTSVRARAISKIILERSKLPGDQNLNGIRLN